MDYKELFIVTCNHSGDGFRSKGLNDPMCTITAARDSQGLVVPELAPFVSYAQHGGNTRAADLPLHTITASTKDQNVVVAPTLVRWVTVKAMANSRARFLRLHPKDSIVVIIDDISRFARNVQAHIKLRETLADAGGILESPSIEFGEDSDSRLVEHMLASVAQHQREKNAEQTSNRMKGRMMNGYSVFAAPIGYIYKKTGSHGKLLTRDEPIASIIQ
nr:recombinase family protein [Pseudaestuariivita rosea]